MKPVANIISEHYSISYLIKKVDGNGEFSIESRYEFHKIDSVSDQVSDALTDIYYKHQNETICGIEILDIERYSE